MNQSIELEEGHQTGFNHRLLHQTSVEQAINPKRAKTQATDKIL
jgi:hypothetical protein